MNRWAIPGRPCGTGREDFPKASLPPGPDGGNYSTENSEEPLEFTQVILGKPFVNLSPSASPGHAPVPGSSRPLPDWFLLPALGANQEQNQISPPLVELRL